MAEQLTLGADYIRWLPTYLRHLDFIDGSVESVRKYLVRHASENVTVTVNLADGATETRQLGEVLWRSRNLRLENDNFCEPVLMHWMSSLSQEIERPKSLTDDKWSVIFEDMDGDGSTIEAFYRDTVWDTIGLGRCGVLVEGPATVSEGAEDAAAKGERSYATRYEPTHILKADKFRGFGPKRGKFSEVILLTGSEGEGTERKMIVRRYWIEKQGANYKARDYKIGKHVFDQVSGASAGLHDEWRKPLDAEPIGEQMQGAFNEIPFVLFGCDPLETSVIYSLVSKNREALNKKSTRDTILYYQGHQRVCFFGVSPEEAAVLNEAVAGFFRDPEASVHVIESGDPAGLTADLQDLKRDAFNLGMLRPAAMNQLVTKQVQSSDSKREDNATYEDYLEYFTDQMQSKLTDVVRFLFWFENNAEPKREDVAVNIGTDFKVAPTAEETAEQSLLYMWLAQFGKPGREAQAEIIATKLLEQRIAAENEDERKQELAEAIRAEGQKEQKLLRDVELPPRPGFNQRLNGNQPPEDKKPELNA